MQKFLFVIVGLLTAASLHAAGNRAADLESASYGAVTNAADPVEKAFQQIMEDDDAAQAEVDQWIRDNQAFAEQGAGSPPALLKRRIQRRFEPVRKAYEDFLQLHPQHSRARAAYASFLGDLGDEEAARAQLEKALTFDTNSPAIYNNLANIYGHSGPVKKAFEFYTKAIQLDPKEPVYYHNFGTTVYLFRKDAEEYFNIDEAQVFEKTFQLYSNAFRLDPDNFPLASDIAQTYYGIRPLRTEEALRAWNRALRIAHDDIEREGVYLHFARIKYLGGRYSEARTHLEAVTNSMYAELKQKILHNLDVAEGKASGLTNAPAAAPSPESKAKERDGAAPEKAQPKDPGQKTSAAEK